jgi:flagellar secretion chaperone FliS
MFVNMSIDKIEEISEAYPSQLIVLLYDEAIASLDAAVDAIGRGEIEARFNATKRAADVVAELYVSLDMDLGGEIAVSLGAIYSHILTQLPQINFGNDVTVAEQLIGLLRPIRDSWFELDERIRCNVEDAEAMDTAELAAAIVAREAVSAEAAR